MNAKRHRRRPSERGRRVLLQRGPVPRRFLLFERSEELAGVRRGGERHLSQGFAGERGERLHEAGLTGRGGPGDDGHPTLSAAMRRSLQSGELTAQQTQGVVIPRADGFGVKGAAGEARVAHVQVTVAQGHRGRRPGARRAPERSGKELDALCAIRRGAKPLREERLEGGVDRAVKVPVVHPRSLTRDVAPSKQVAQVKLPRRARPGKRAANLLRGVGERSDEMDHPLDDEPRHRRVERGGDVHEVGPLHGFHVHAGEPVQERFGQALAAASLLHRVLRGKHPKSRRAPKRLSELGHENLCAVIQRRVQTLEHGLRREVELVQ